MDWNLVPQPSTPPPTPVTPEVDGFAFCMIISKFAHFVEASGATQRPANVPREIYNLYTHTAKEESLQAKFSGAEQPPANKSMHKNVRYFTIMFFVSYETRDVHLFAKRSHFQTTLRHTRRWYWKPFLN